MIYTKAWRMYEDLKVDLAQIAALSYNITSPSGFRGEPNRRNFTPK